LLRTHFDWNPTGTRHRQIPGKKGRDTDLKICGRAWEKVKELARDR